MVTRTHKRHNRRLFLAEHREKAGISADQLAEILGVTRQTVHRWEREPNRMNPVKQADYAHALGLGPEDLWRFPGRRSVDAMIANVPDEKAQDVAEMVSIFLKSGPGR